MLERIEVVLGLMGVVAALALLAGKLNAPEPILFVLGGLALAFVPGMPGIQLHPDLVFYLFLPALLYPAALFTPWRDFRANLRPILLLAVGLILFTTLAVGFLAHYFIPELPLAAAFVLGAIISPTDPIAAIAIAQRLKVPPNVVAIIEGESLVNDSTALVAYRFGVVAVVSGTFSLRSAGGEFVTLVVGGIMVGLIVGWLTAWILACLDDPSIQITVSLLTPFAAYLAAERLHVSGVLGVVAAGFYHGWRAPELLTARMRLQAGPIWSMMEFLLNGLLFTLIGLQLPEVLRALGHRPLGQLIGYGVLFSLLVILARMLWVFPAAYLPALLMNRFGKPQPVLSWKRVTVVAWTGMRGGVSLAAALAVPVTIQGGAAFPGRDLILFLTFSVILATLVAQGLSLPALIRWLKLEEDRSLEREETEARLRANHAALARLDEIAEREQPAAEIIRRLRVEYEDRIDQLEKVEEEEGAAWSANHLFSREYERLALEGLKTERQVILKLRNERIINDEALRRIQRDIDLAEARLRYPRE